MNRDYMEGRASPALQKVKKPRLGPITPHGSAFKVLNPYLAFSLGQKYYVITVLEHKMAEASPVF